MGIELKKPLKPNTKYYIGFMTKLARCGYATNKLGVRFSSVEWNERCALDYGYDHFHTNEIITDTVNWTPLIGSFIADADSLYKYIVIGNFHYVTDIDTIKINQTGNIIINSDRSTYLVDNIVVSTDSAYVYGLLTGVKPTNYELRKAK